MVTEKKYGICCLSIVPVRTEPSDKSELCTQLLWGDAYEVIGLSENEKWMQIRIAFDAYEGWIDAKQNTFIDEATYQSDKKPGFYSKSIVATLEGEDEVTPVLAGSRLPGFKDATVNLEAGSYTFKGEAIDGSVTSSFAKIKELAYTYLKAPYLWGGKTHFGIDCSGFVQQVFKVNGFQLPRDAWQQAEKGVVVQFKEVQPGDLAFFSNANGRVIHIGIVLEDHKIIHAHGEVRVDILDENGIFNTSKKLYSHQLSIIKRII